MSAIALSNAPRAPASKVAPPPPSTDRRGDEGHDLAFAQEFARSLLVEQKVPLLAQRSASRALALLLARSVRQPGEPVCLSAQEGARICDFEPRTWWLVKRRLLELGHLVASTGGGPPSGKPGGRGRKGAYFVARPTLDRFLGSRPLNQTVMAPAGTLNGLPETLNATREERNPSHHRPLRLLERKGTSDVPSLEGDEGRERTHLTAEHPSMDRPTVESVWAWVHRERSVRVKLRLLRLLETLLVTEALGKTVMPPGESVMPSAETVMDSRSSPPPPSRSSPGAPVGGAVSGKERRVRASVPLWTGESGEEAKVFTHVRSILEWANREHRASFDVERSAKDTLRYPFERVRAAVANVLLKRARGYRFANAGAVLWEGITLEGYKLDEFSVACFDEVLARLARGRSGDPHRGAPSGRPASLPRTAALPSPLPFQSERQRRFLLQEAYQKLPESERCELDRRAEVMACEELGVMDSPLRRRFLQLDKRNELLAARMAGLVDAGAPETRPQDAQI